MHAALGLVLAATIVIALPFALALVIAALARNLQRWCRNMLAFARGQVRAWSARRLWTVLLLQVLALAVFTRTIVGELSFLELIGALLIYPLFVCALSLSLLARLPIVRALWNDVFFKIFLGGSQLIVLYLAKGGAAYWIADLWQISADNAPMARIAAMGFLILMFNSLLFIVAALLFQLLFMAGMLGPVGRGKKTVARRPLSAWFSPTRATRHGETGQGRLPVRTIGRLQPLSVRSLPASWRPMRLWR
ncbi:hypothetical protein [Bordetella sp. 2513F-2]